MHRILELKDFYSDAGLLERNCNQFHWKFLLEICGNGRRNFEVLLDKRDDESFLKKNGSE